MKAELVLATLMDSQLALFQDDPPPQRYRLLLGPESSEKRLCICCHEIAFAVASVCETARIFSDVEVEGS